MYSIDQGSQPINVSSVTLDGSTFRYSVDLIGGNYEGTIIGNWTQGQALAADPGAFNQRYSVGDSGPSGTAEAYGSGCEPVV